MTEVPAPTILRPPAQPASQAPPLALAYAPPRSYTQRHGTKLAALAGFASAGAWLVVSPEGLRVLGMCALFPAAFLVVLRWSGAATQVALWAWCLLAGGMLLALSDRLFAAATFSLNPGANYVGEYVVLPEWRMPLALLSFAWLPPFLFVLARGGIDFEHAGVRREVAPFMLVMGMLFSVAHPAAVLLEAAVGGDHAHFQTVTSADGRYRAEVYAGSWLGEDRYFAYLCDPSPAPVFGRRIRFDGDGRGGPLSLVTSPDGTVEMRSYPE